MPAGRDREGADAPDVRRRTLAWLDPRLEEVPGDLAAALRDCVRAVEPDPDASSVPGLLARAAVAELDRVATGSRRTREAAVRLLAADAALTYAFEAAAELDVDVPALARDVGLRGRIGERLAELGADGSGGDEDGGPAPAEGRGHGGPRAAEPGGDEA